MRSRSTWIAGAIVGCVVAIGTANGGCEPPAFDGTDFDTKLPKRRFDDPEAASSDAVSSSSGSPSSPSTTTGDAGRDAATLSPDASAAGDVSSPPMTQTFTIGTSDCNGGHCSGGYDDKKELAGNLPTATKQCLDRGFTRATDFTIGGQPGGRFCSFNGTVYGCDPSCSGCNLMTSVTCAKP